MARFVELLHQSAVAQVSDLFRLHVSIDSPPKRRLQITAPDGPQGKLRINVISLKNVTLKNGQSPELSTKLTLVGEKGWYCEGKTKAQLLDPKTGICSWNECIEFSRLNDYTDMNIKVGFYGRFGRFKTIGSSRVQISTVAKLEKPQRFMLYRDRKRKHQCGVIKLSFELSTPSAPSASSDMPGSGDYNPSEPVETVCSDYLLKLVSDLQAQVKEKEERIKSMQTYIDRLLPKILHYCPQLLENK